MSRQPAPLPNAPNAPNAIVSGLVGRCPRCGKGRLFSSYLTLAPACAVCGLDYGFADSGDGPAVFVIFLVAPLVLLLAFTLNAIVPVAPWLLLVIWIPLTLILCLALLPPFKGVLINVQYRHDAHEGHR